MNLTNLRNAVTSKVGLQILTVRKYSPVILFAAGTIGVVATVVLASRATLKLTDILDEAEEMREKIETLEHTAYTDDDRRMDLLKLKIKTGTNIAKLYAPTVIVGLASIAALTGSHVILTRRNVAITAAYAATDRAFRQYRDRVRNALGVDQDEQFRYGFEEREVVDETKNGPKVSAVRRVGLDGASGYAKYFDEGSPNWDARAGYNLMFLRSQETHFNNRLYADGYVFLNDVYHALGLKREGFGQQVGWILDGGASDNYISFGCFDPSNQGLRDFVNGWTDAILLDFNVDGIILDKI